MSNDWWVWFSVAIMFFAQWILAFQAGYKRGSDKWFKECISLHEKKSNFLDELIAKFEVTPHE